MAVHSLFEETSKQSLSNQIFVILRERILNDEYKKGDRLNELALSRELHISRTPVREALKELESEGLVESVPNKGVFVKGFSARDIDDLFKIRKILEVLMIELAIERMDAEHMNKIQEIFDLMEFYTSKKDFEKVDELNIKFHEAIYSATQSQYLEQLLSDVHFYVSVTSRHSVKHFDRMDSAIEEHRKILDSIKNNNKTLAAKLMNDHIEETQLLVRQFYKEKEANE